MERIIDRGRFVEFARERGMRPDWHEPDEQGLTARIEGTAMDFDNAGFWPADEGARTHIELHVIFSDMDIEEGRRVRGRDLACVNLASLCAWASEPHPDVPTAVSAALEGMRRHMTEAVDQFTLEAIRQRAISVVRVV